MSSSQDLIDRIRDRKATVGVVGLGYVGLPLALLYAGKGFRTLGFDVDPEKITALKASNSYIKHIDAATVGEAVASGKLEPIADYKRIAECDAIILCVPTPLNKNREPDMTYIEATARAIAPHLQRGQIVVLESTTYPGTTDELLKRELQEGSGLSAENDFLLAYSPEREDPGNAHFNTQRIPKVVGGLGEAAREVAVALYESVLEKVIPVSSTRVAEMTKLLENIFRNVNIALVNELKVLCDRMDIDVWEVIEAASTKPFGYMPFYPGPGLGGHCIPIDPFYLTWKAREYDLSTRFVELAGEINSAMPHYVVDRTILALNEHEKSLRGSRVLVLGLAYKPNVEDVRESPALRIIEILRERGADVQYSDPHVPQTHKMRNYDLNLSSIELTDDVLRTSDAVLIVTDHSGVDYDRVVALAPLVVDTRNATKSVVSNREKIVKA